MKGTTIVVLVLVVLIGSSSGMNVKTWGLGTEMMKEDFRKLGEIVKSIDDKVEVGYPGSSVNNHHYIPRQDFNNHGGDDGGILSV
ncbi:hypothetical protein G4B88_020939 [Cannabis sativa]|uniref:Uncharacterized protein n=1 Tax=Cannabis sativa TaxID=3483 RepID=A0A7J6FEP3_CANSA|nr:hypothetical protein G4B88_020939 [Cannabis sativa]